MKKYYIKGNSTNPYINLACERYLMDIIDDETIYFFFWQNDRTIVIGRNQEIATECKSKEFIESGGFLARRYSGGGAVYHDLGNLCYSIISNKKDVEEISYDKIICRALEHLGIDSVYNGRNDILVKGKKISGNAFYTVGDIICQHGTVLFDTDIQIMNYYLTPTEEKLRKNSVQSVSSRVCNLKDTGLKIISIEEFINEIIKLNELEKCDVNFGGIKETSYYQQLSGNNWIYGGK